MDFLTFFSKAIDALAWPIATVVLVTRHRDEIGKLVPQLKRVKAGPLEAEFEREVMEVKANTGNTRPTNQSCNVDPASKNSLIQLAELHPRSAILEAWTLLEATARTVLQCKEKPNELRSYIPAARLAEPLAELGILNQRQVTLFHELRRLRNDVAHSTDLRPSAAAAKNYLEMSSQLQGQIEGVAETVG
ncbi:hypothetical protein [Vogesella oryzae]|uniref:hypothetical protein n=1 Tax=Vogesella oryzae TaxID=1735285 RepID=UPI001582BA4F|nr:hypothetical protein [Vogesella oryzae]